MTQKNNILNELKELNSSLSSQTVVNVYVVPEGYFDSLAGILLQKIKASEAADSSTELSMVSPLLAGITKQPPHFLPAGYFDRLEEKIMSAIRHHADYQTCEEEIGSLSPLLSNLKKEMPFHIPEGYFETINPVMQEALPGQARPAKVVSFLNRRWVRMAAAAVITGLVVISGIRLLNNNTAETPDKAIAKIEKKIAKDMKNQDITSEDVDNFFDLTDAIASVDTKQAANTPVTNQAKDLFKDIPDDEIVNFLDQLPDDTNDTGALN